ncbi:MAG: hypothetical protein Q8T09_10840 [Candidatus Melainabacteria bacterium]|nr:hypothetical protein [Candidatus Melainabacteria bacterium]
MSENPAFQKLKGTHSCRDSALKCVDCNSQVCPKCFVQCAVGNRCKKCANRFTSHVLLTSPKVLAKLSAASVLLGIAWGYIQPHLEIMGIYGYFIQFVAALFLGKLLHKVASYKLGTKVATVAALTLIIGLAIGPSRETVLNAIQYSNLPAAEGGDPNALGAELISLSIFLIAALMPFIRKN